MESKNLLNLALELHKKNNLKEAKKIYLILYDKKNKNPQLLKYLGMIEFADNNFEMSLFYQNEYLKYEKNDYSIYNNIGATYYKLRSYEKAKTNLNKALSLKFNNAESHMNLGLVYVAVGDYLKGFHHYNISLQIEPKKYEIYFNKANLYIKNSNFLEALRELKISLKIKSDNSLVLGTYLYCKLMLCTWDDEFYYNRDALLKLYKSQFYGSDSMIFMLLFDNNEINYNIAVNLNQNKFQIKNNIKKEIKNKIKIGYYSPDFRYHPLSILLVEQLENHNKNQFELYGFSFRSNYKDPMQQRIQDAMDHYYEVDGMSDIEVANLSQELGIDIAVDLCGHTQGSRPAIFAARAAPVQINHLGFPGTSGSSYIDYYVADKYSVPPHEQKHFTEKIAYVPCVYTYDRQRKISQKLLNKSDYGLPENKFVFTCQNSVQKITPELFETWMNILKSVPSSILWLQDSNHNATSNLKREAELRGVKAERLIFMKREIVDWNQEQERISKYLLSYKFADLFLDTYPYNGGTTVLDALSVGLPVVTLCGNSHAARMASSALNAVEMNELIAKNVIEYQNIATQLALNSQKFESIKNKLKNNIQEKPLFDILENVRHLEEVYISLNK